MSPKSGPLVNTGHHVHVHDWEGGERRFEHSHPYPSPDADGIQRDGARPHAHSNGRHSHPHDHAAYEHPLRAMYRRLAADYRAMPPVPDRGGGAPGDRFPF